MARLNIEEEFWLNPRIKKLQRELGEHLAVGEIICFWRLAQEYWCRGRKPIPHDIYLISEFSSWIEQCGIAIKKEDGVYCFESEKYFDWLIKRKEAGKLGGKVSGGVRLERSKNEPNDINNLTEAKRSKLKQNEPSTSTSTSTSKKEKERKKETTLNSPQKNVSLPEATSSKIWEAYSTAFEIRYKVKPKRNFKINSQAKSLLARLGEEEAIEIVKFYISHNDRWYVRNGHSLGLCLKDAEKLHMEWTSGKKVTSVTAATTESRDHNATVAANYLRKSEQKEIEREVNESGVLEENGDTSGDLSS